MKEIFGIITFAILFFIGITANVIYFSKVIPTLSRYREKEKSHYEVLPSKQWKQLWGYRKVSIENNQPLFYSNFMIALPFLMLLLILLLVLLLS
ncbi:hypothetical protein JW879_07190 [candidate division WOR-3 bacterium]|nr:hypothetical protein [candidate division WOR-3 bacterium]